MALDPKNKGHLFQIEAGTEGRLQGHKFEEVVTEELNKIDFMSGNTVIECIKPNVYHGNPANALVSHISQDKGKQIDRLNAYWLGGLATARAGDIIIAMINVTGPYVMNFPSTANLSGIHTHMTAHAAPKVAEIIILDILAENLKSESHFFPVSVHGFRIG